MADSRREREKVLAEYRTKANEKKEFAEKVERRVSNNTTQGRRNMSQPGGAEIKWATLDCG